MPRSSYQPGRFVIQENKNTDHFRRYDIAGRHYYDPLFAEVLDRGPKYHPNKKRPTLTMVVARFETVEEASAFIDLIYRRPPQARRKAA